MHWTAAQPGLLDAERELVLIQQTPAEIVFVSAADTELSCVAAIWGSSFGARLRLAHAFPLRQPVAADHYVDSVICGSDILVARLLGGKAYFAHFIQALINLRDEDRRPRILLLSGTETEDPELTALSDFPVSACQRLHQLFYQGGEENIRLAGHSIEQLLRNPLFAVPLAEPTPTFGLYRASAQKRSYTAWICFYRAWLQAGDLQIVDSLFAALEEMGFDVCCLYSFSLRSAGQHLLNLSETSSPDVILTLQSFSISAGETELSIFDQIRCPVIQVPAALCSEAVWKANGLGPAEVAMNVALPELDGRVFSTVTGFREEISRLPDVQFSLKRLLPAQRQIAFIAEQARCWARLRKLANSEKRVAIILSNYPNRDGRIGNGVGLDTPASAIKLLERLRAEGYMVDQLPTNGDELMRWLQAGPTNDVERSYGKAPFQTFGVERLRLEIEHLPPARKQELLERWDLPSSIPISGVQLGNIFIGIQPPRGFSLQPQAIYHSPTLPPPPEYLAFYLWIRQEFGADAIIHLGKHGNLEWLPGRATALGEDDYPRICLGPLPHLYPFIVNNPGEGAQAKRRTSAVIIDHLTPPLVRSGLYNDLEKVERLLEEHAHAIALYPSRAKELEGQISECISSASWRAELSDTSLQTIGNYLCEIKESQIRSGLHILGTKPADEVGFLLSLIRIPNGERESIVKALTGRNHIEDLTVAERDAFEVKARAWLEGVLQSGYRDNENRELQKIRAFVRQQLVPRIAACSDEIDNILSALCGKFVPPGPAGAPTRGKFDVLPTGRNFFSIDPRSIPTQTAWHCGKAMADTLIERHRQEQGEFPRRLALVVWGTSNMRTGGDDVAQALWLWGCEPVWEEASGRVVDFRILPLGLLGRPRVDVLLRVSGLFRDAFGDVLRLLATVPKRLALLDEPPEMNPVRESWLLETENSSAPELAAKKHRATLRVFSSEPGAYGTGMLPLLDAGNWDSKTDLTEVFCRWGGFAYDSDGKSSEQIDLFRSRLARIDVVHQNQDNREHDILDSDDYFQFQGGLQASVTVLRGKSPAVYHGDSSNPERPRVRTLEEELVRVIRSRVLNPRWIEGMRRHGYKGAFEMSSTIDYLFGYGATTGMIKDHQYEEIAQKLLLDPEQQKFFRDRNPAALQEAAERMLEAVERNLWENPSPATLSALEATLVELHGTLE